MRKLISCVLCFILMASASIPVFAKEQTYGTLKAQFSDDVRNVECLNVMVENNHVYVNAKVLAERLGYQIDDTNDNYVEIYNFENDNLPFGLTRFYYDKTDVEHMLYVCILDDYEAPFPSIHNEKGIWIPLEYSLLILNSGMLLVGDTVLIDIPEKKIPDLFYNISKNQNTYLFNWAKDFGYTDTDVTGLGISSHIINQFNGLLEFDGASWNQIFQSLAMDSSAYDKRYGQNIAMLLCTESDGELEKASEEIEKYLGLLDKEGEVGSLLSNYSDSLEVDVNVLYERANKLFEDIKERNSGVAQYNRTYDVLEKAVDKQTWFSNTGGVILEMQESILGAVSVLDTAVKVSEVVQYGVEFANQDKFSVAALECYLENPDSITDSADVIKQSMKEYSDTLKSNLALYSATRFFEENAGQWVRDAIQNGNLLGSQANMVLVAWNLASDFVPFISNGLSAADKFELALYSSCFQTNTLINYQQYRDYVFEEEKNITEANLYKLTQYCYLHMKSCYITRSAALASLDGKRESVKEQIYSLIEYQNGINSDIAEILVILKKAKETNDKLIFGFLPSDNAEYLKEYKKQKSEICNIIFDNADGLSNEQICNVIHEASEFAWEWFWDSAEGHIDENDTYIGTYADFYEWEYKRVDHEGIHSVEDVIELTKHYFTEEVATKLVKLKEWHVEDNALYVSEPEGIGGVEGSRYDVNITKETDTRYRLTICEYLSDGSFWEGPYDVGLEYIDGYWVFDSVLVGAPSKINIVSEEERWKIDYIMILKNIFLKYIDEYTQYITLFDKYTHYLVYCIHDLDDDGIKELIVKEGTCEADMRWKVYTISEGKVVLVDDFMGSHSWLYYRAEGGAYMRTKHMGVEELYEITLSEKAINIELISSVQMDPGESHSFSAGNELEWAYITDYSLLHVQ